jgi:O-antigen ligase
MAAIQQQLARLPTSPAMWVSIAGLALAPIVGWFASQGHDRTTFAVALAIPLAILILRWPWSIVLLWLSVMPFLVVGDGVAGPETWMIHRLLPPAVLAVVLGYRIVRPTPTFRLSVVDFALVVFIVLFLANIQLLSSSPVRMTTIFYDRIVIPIVLYWLIRLTAPDKRELKWLLIVMIGLVLLQFTVGLLSWLAPSVVPAQWLGRAGERTVGTVRGPAPYTTTLVMGALMSVAYLPTIKTQWLRVALFTVVALAFVGVAISFSRGSWLGAALVLLGLFFVQRKIAKRLLAVLVLVVAAVGLASIGTLSYAGDRLSDEDTADSRVVTNNAAIYMISERPLLGYGYGNFEEFDERFKTRIGDLPAEEGSAHHTFLALAAENGIPALILYFFPALWLLVLTISRRRQIMSQDPINGPLLAVLWLGLLHETVVMNFMDMLHSSTWGNGLWWVSLALIHVVITRSSAQTRAVAAVPADGPPYSRRTSWMTAQDDR